MSSTGQYVGHHPAGRIHYFHGMASPAGGDDAHPAFSKLFVETEFLPELQALIAHRRKRLDSDPDIWVAQFIVSDNKSATAVQYETARQAFFLDADARWARPCRYHPEASLHRPLEL